MSMSSTSTEKVEERKKMVCPCCGMETMWIPAEVDEHIRDAFLASLLSGVSYQQTYQLFNGVISITVCQISNTLRDKLVRLANKSINTQIDQLKKELTMALGRLNQLSTVLKIVIHGKNGQEDKVYNINQIVQSVLQRLLVQTDADKVRKISSQLIQQSKVSAVPLYMINRVVDTHQKQVAILMQSGFDDSFSTGIVHVH